MKHFTLPLLVVSLVFLGAFPLEARYIPPKLEDLLGSSDLVAVGVISEVGQGAYVLHLEEVLVGSPSPGSTARIQSYQNWICCSTRYQPYAVGERLFVMVRAVVHEEYDYAQSYGAWESEFPIYDGQVMSHGYTIPGAERLPLTKHREAAAIPLEVVVEATEDFHRCWVWHPESIEARCSVEEISELVQESPFHRRLLGELPRPER